MDETTQRALQTAYQLIKENKREAAFSLLSALLKSNPQVADAWYLLGFAVTDPEKRKFAYQQVLRLDPNHAAAQKQLAKLLAPPPPPPVAEAQPAPAPERPPKPAAATPPTVVKKKPAPRWLWALVGLIALVCVATGVVVGMQRGIFPTFGATPTRPYRTPTPLPPTPIPSPTPIYEAVFRVKSCPFDLPLGTRVKCGVVKVPQDREKNLTDLIELPVVIYQSSKPEAEVLLYLQGGPGVESLDWSLALFDDYVAPFLEDYDMVFFDPRGTGRSTPRLDCPELNDIYLEAYFQARSEAEAFNLFTEAWGQCNQRFQAEGINPAAFNTTQSAADVRDIVHALGYEQVNLIGISYGTRLALTIMRDHPEIVRSVTIDSVVPMQRSMFSSRTADVEYALDKMFTDCAASPRCSSAYPDLRDKFNALIERFDKAPVPVKIQDPSVGFVFDVPVNGVDMLSAVVAGMHNSQLLPVIPKAIYDIEKGDYTFLSFALGSAGGDYDALSMGTYFATACHEQVYYTTAEAMDAALATASPVVRKFSLASMFGETQRVFQLCEAWGAQPFNPLDGQPVTINIPTLVLAGEYDPTTPVTTAEMVAQDLPNDYFYVIPGTGHGATVGNECALGIVRQFLRDPTNEPVHDCLAELEAFEFFLPYDGSSSEFAPMAEPNLGLSGLVPRGWRKETVDSIYYRRAYLFDPTLAMFGALPYSKAQTFELISASFASSGFDETPTQVGTRAANGLNWTIYGTRFNGEPVFLALAEAGRFRTVILAMVVSAPEKDAAYDGWFLPVLDGLVAQ